MWGLAAALLFTLAAARETAVSPDLAGPLWANVLCAAGMTPPMIAGRRHPSLTVLVALSAAMAQTAWLTPSTQLAMPLLAVLVAAAAGDGIRNASYNSGVAVKDGASYDASVWVRTTTPQELTLAVENGTETVASGTVDVDEVRAQLGVRYPGE